MRIAIYGTTLNAGVMAGLFAEYGHQAYWCQYPVEEYGCSVEYQDKTVNDLIQKQINYKNLIVSECEDIPNDVDAYFLAFNSHEYEFAVQVLKNLQEQPIIHPKLMINGSSFGLEGTKKLQAFATKDNWCYLPDMVQEGNALNSITKVQHIVVGVETAVAKTKIKEILRPFYSSNHHYLFMPIQDAEFTKLSISGMLATRISYMNDLAQVAEKMGVDIANVRLGLGADSRIGSSYLAPGVGFGGENFSHDIITLTKTIAETGTRSELLEQVWNINEQQKEVLFRKLWNYYQCNLKGKVIAIWGASFKENTARINFSPIHEMLTALWAQGATVQLHDPQALPLIAKKYGRRDDLILCEHRYEAVENADALCLLTAWKEYLSLDYTRLHQLMSHPLILDGRNVYDANYVKAQGFAYEGVGRI
ncbi:MULTISPECIES: nucleotide sugar dehydrogenase [Acinetobacter]|jgi:UDPglucose 6-dehydrogenase|uniref:nucleotide sugar dehydrogenase n=1 Tax=Acinetobacter TaxID=469 RepID=UPI0018A26A1C|nr:MULTISPECIES: nucleotide sugar dehydrogenase [Acinetobacter]MBF7690561.1 UDP-glucose/GDP-mannose dehydrogenase family protein [Acinetobacter pollinis]MBF7693539.1 UDP-glucose/GDP-mannose dehydrogenase family protein [Acinetobacter pollinis]MBF7698073.1 UDP-glucose/GDP-mannose dehydrogenase family protein [Acinetobacter pollinis]MBF7701072.1 UDP-glucose/GDP-mannose dehydrogenase family protein [Acinetobacter pollinis]WEV48874.1 nucleotide sugar dehydrogenase [Acinetobacter sp. ESL0695]